MKTQEIKFKNINNKYSVFIGNNIIFQISKKIKKICPNAKKIALVFDKKIPTKLQSLLRSKLRSYDLELIKFTSSEKSKSLNTVNYILKKLLNKNFNRSDIIISVGGGITGDVVGFVASIYKRGINLINLPTTLLAQVDSAIGGKTGVNSVFGKNLIGTFFQPKLVIADTIFLNSLPKREIICGYAEILKHAIIKDSAFFHWLIKNTENIFLKDSKKLIYAIRKSCQIKMYFVNKDVNENSLRMKLNFGHTFAHAIEVKNKYSKNITHGEAVLAGIILATRLSVTKNICKIGVLRLIEKIYNDNNLSYTYEKYLNTKTLFSLIPFLKNDKKNNDNKINFILLKKIGVTTKPNSNKISTNNLKKMCRTIVQY